MLQKILNHLQRQSRAKRENYAFLGAVAFTGCIALVWFVQQPYLFINSTTQSAAVQTNGNAQESAGVFSSFRRQIDERVDTVREQFENTREQVSDSGASAESDMHATSSDDVSDTTEMEVEDTATTVEDTATTSVQTEVQSSDTEPSVADEDIQTVNE